MLRGEVWPQVGNRGPPGVGGPLVARCVPRSHRAPEETSAKTAAPSGAPWSLGGGAAGDE